MEVWICMTLCRFAGMMHAKRSDMILIIIQVPMWLKPRQYSLIIPVM